ncbi:NEK protein kinase [Phytophthora palmivora]|uniref:non-specific serine/threonine protein kinase n=1 Tax=Phytophthora palmivora TaxID=4796 RepID=A0A2P4XKC8_9STRA|nr:NEK protein kinase [Phytophthora palmivora]
MHRFEEIKCIGRGSYGSAYLVRGINSLHERFVVKKIPMELLSAKEKDQSFREVELLAKLKHPNVVEYMENFVVDNVLHIVMAYCDGGDLSVKIKEQQRVREEIVGPDNDPTDPRGYFSVSQVLDWFVQMAMAIKYLHGQRVLHRDLKTSNVFLTTENVVKLGDFGIAKTLDSTLDQAKTVVGTPYYMSPEVCESKPYSYASDVWSLGCVLFEMLALRHAFDAPNILTLILKIVQQDFAPVPPHYDNEISDLLRKLLDKDPERRPSMEEIFTMPYIRHHMEGLVASGPMSSPVRPQRRRASRDKKSIAWGREEANGKANMTGDANSSIDEDDDDDDDSRFHAEAEELMNPNFQSEYSEECIDSLQIYYSSKETKDNKGTGAPSLSESSMMRELELDADSDDDDVSANSSSSEYEAEENFYSDESSDIFDQSGTQYSDDFEDPDAEIIEYADDEFVIDTETKLLPT